MWSFGAFCDEFYVNTRLYLKLELEPSRETVLHFMEQIRRAFPQMSRLRRREDGGLILDEDRREAEPRRYVRLDANALKLGAYRPENGDAVNKFAEMILHLAPPQLSLSDLDFDYMEVAFGFDLEYAGNHDELVAETLFADHPLMQALMGGGRRIIDCQPFLGVAVSDDCERQVYIDLKGRTSTFEVRSGEFEPTMLSVYVTARQYWGATGQQDLAAVHRELVTCAERHSAESAVPHVVQPLASAIASRR